MRLVQSIAGYLFIFIASAAVYIHFFFEILTSNWINSILDIIFFIILAIIVKQSRLKNSPITKEFPLVLFIACTLLVYSLYILRFIFTPYLGIASLIVSLCIFILSGKALQRHGKHAGFKMFSVLNIGVFMVFLYCSPSLLHWFLGGMDRFGWNATGSDRPGVEWLVKTRPGRDGFQVVYPGGRTEYVKNFTPSMIQAIGDEAVLLSYGYPHQVDKIDLRTLSVRTFYFEGGRRPFFFLSPDNRRFYTGSYKVNSPNRKIDEVKIEDMQLQKEIPFGTLKKANEGIPLDGFRMGRAIDAKKYVCTFRGKIFALDDSGKVTDAYEPSRPFPCNHFSFSEELNRIYAPAFPFLLYSISMEPLKLKAERLLFWGRRTVPIPERKEVLADGSLSVLVLDSDTLQTKRKIYTGHGIRCLDFDPKRNWIYAAKYFSGKLEVYDYESGKKIGGLKAGPMLDCVSYSPGNDCIYTGSSAGVLKISPEIFR